MLPCRLKRIGIEKTSAVKRDPRYKSVVQGALKHVIVFRLAMQQEEPVVYIYIADGRACLAVGRHVRQFEVCSESFAVSSSAYAAGNIVFHPHNIIPNPVDGLYVSRITGKSGNISHSGIHICRPDSMTHGLILLRYRLVGLTVGIAPRSTATFVEKECGLVEIFSVTGER